MGLLEKLKLPTLLLLCASLTSCGGFFTKETTTSGGGSGGSTNVSVYVANNNAGNPGSVVAYTVNTSTGALTQRSAISLPGSPQAMALFSSKALYVVQSNSSISAYNFDANGDLVAIAGSPYATGGSPSDVIVEPQGRYLYVANAGDGTISTYTINATTGALAGVGAALSLGASPLSLAADPSGKFIYATLGANGIAAMKIQSDGTLALTRIVPPLTGGHPQSLVVPGSGAFAYVADGVTGIEIFSVNSSTGDLSPASTSVVTAGGVPVLVKTDVAGKFLYSVNQASNTISGFAILSDGSLTQISGSPFSISTGATGPDAIAFDPSNKFAYVTNFNGSPGISIFTLDTANTGKLSLTSSAAAGSEPVAVVSH